MESVGSNWAEEDARGPGKRKPYEQALEERVTRALTQGLLLLHRSPESSTFFVMGSTSNVYTVVLSRRPSCSCPDRARRCKHILFVLIRVLGVPRGDPSHGSHTLSPSRLSRLLATPASPDSLAPPALCRRFHQLFSASAPEPIHVRRGSCCPVCLEDMSDDDARHKLVACARCRNQLHEACLIAWKRSLGRRRPTCVICRARWRNTLPANYLNLAPHNDHVTSTSTAARPDLH